MAVSIYFKEKRKKLNFKFCFRVPQTHFCYLALHNKYYKDIEFFNSLSINYVKFYMYFSFGTYTKKNFEYNFTNVILYLKIYPKALNI